MDIINDTLKKIAEVLDQYNKGLIMNHEALREIVVTATTNEVLTALDNA